MARKRGHRSKEARKKRGLHRSLKKKRKRALEAKNDTPRRMESQHDFFRGNGETTEEPSPLDILEGWDVKLRFKLAFTAMLQASIFPEAFVRCGAPGVPTRDHQTVLRINCVRD